jgi:nucleoside-diphosphate-sugar epimerase
MRIVIGGASGYLGRPLVDRLRSAGHQVMRLVPGPVGR